MTRNTYGPIVVTQPTPSTGDDASTVGFVPDPLDVYDSDTNPSPITDLLAYPGGQAGGIVSGQVVPDATTGAAGWQGPEGYAGQMWVSRSGGVRYPVDPNDLATRTGGVSTVTVDGGTPQSGAVSITSPTWSTISGKPAVVAAGTTAAAARTAIGAFGAPDVNVPGGIVGIDSSTGLVDPTVFGDALDLSAYAQLTDLGVQVEAIATGDDSNLAAALASVSSTLGVNGFIAVKVAGS